MCGQILNYAFVAVDNDYKIIDQCKGDIKISPIQLPAPAAILANGIDVAEHQKKAALTEPHALASIAEFLTQMITREKGPITLVGFNSSKFDLPYLRTSFIRNGINPYFGGKIIYRDILALARYLSCTAENFPRIAAKESDRLGRLSLRLESLAQHFGLIEGQQLHSSYEDTLLTISLARKLLEGWNIDVRTFEAYQGDTLQTQPRTGRVFEMIEPQYDLLAKDISTSIPVTLLDQNHRYALWVNLEDYKNNKGRRSVIWATKGTNSFFTKGVEYKEGEYLDVAQRALGEFGKINIYNFFTKSSCDIEHDIYRLDMEDIGVLYKAIWEDNQQELKSLESRDAVVLFKRFQLANASLEAQRTKPYQDMFKKYVRYRYGGEMNLDKFKPEDGSPGTFHPTFGGMLTELESLMAQNPSRIKALKALKNFYLSSPIVELIEKNAS